MEPSDVIMIASGDLRPAANVAGWPAQQAAEQAVTAAIREYGRSVRRGHPVDAAAGHGFIHSQRHGMEIFRTIAPDAPLVVVEAVWQYSHHLLAGLMTHRGPLLTVGNWSGQWPGLVGLLNLNACLAKAGRLYSTLWSADFRDASFRSGLGRWLDGEPVVHDTTHVHPLAAFALPPGETEQGRSLARVLRRDKAIIGVFDEGCMGMYNAIIPDELLHATGVFKERLSQSALYAAMRRVPADEARAVRTWLEQRGMRFHTGPDPARDLTDDQILDQCRMYVAAVRMADDFGCDAIGIQYQQGLKDLCPASDLVEGLLNNAERPPVLDAAGQRTLYEGRPLPHFNEVDECAGLDALITNRVWSTLGFAPETTLHDVRFGEPAVVDGRETFVWVFEISGAVPPSHFARGYADAVSERQPPMYFPLGGGTIKGVSKAGEIVWSRVFVEAGRLHADIGRGRAVTLPAAETERRWALTTPQWPIMHAVLDGVDRDQLMARHRSNHIQVVYAPDAGRARQALAVKAAMMAELGIEVSLCGTTGL
jgi:hypothetical protein